MYHLHNSKKKKWFDYDTSISFHDTGACSLINLDKVGTGSTTLEDLVSFTFIGMANLTKYNKNKMNASGTTHMILVLG